MPSARRPGCQWTATWLVMVGVAGAAGAGGLETAPPKDVHLAGLWKINAELSDDAQKIIERRRGESAPRANPPGRRGRISIPIPDAGDILGGVGGIGRDDGTDPSDGGVGGTRGTGSGSHLPEHRETRTDPDHEEKMRVFVDQLLAKPPEDIEIEQRPDGLTVQSADSTNACKPGESTQVLLPGTVIADRQCGWRGATFVIEVKSRTGAMRTDRYTLSKGGDRLTVRTTLSGSPGRWSGLEIRHVYDRAVALPRQASVSVALPGEDRF